MAYELPRAKPWGEDAWPYSPLPPQRFTTNRHRYLARGGLVRVEEDMRRFVADGQNGDDPARFFFLSLILDQIHKENIAGDLAEIGVYRGDTAALIADMARKLGRTAYLFDTFEGFSARDLQGVDACIPPDFADTSLEAVRARVGDEAVRFHKGYFPETTRDVPGDNAYGLVHIDCDLYAPIRSALEYFYPRMTPGGFIVVHDYASLHWPGAERAVDEFFADRPESVIVMPDGSGSAVVRRATIAGVDNWMLRRSRALLDSGWIGAAAAVEGGLLTDGWDQPEQWGVWGIGAEHCVTLPLGGGPDISSVLVELEATTVLIGDRESHTVAIVRDDAEIGRWTFGPDDNLGIRSIEIPVTPAARDAGLLAFTLRISDMRAPNLLDPANPDRRPLGLGVFRFRFTGR